MAKLRDVNSTDVADAIRLGCQTMQRVFNADDHDRPFFDAWARPEARLGFECPYTEAHVPGRHLNALLAAEEVLGVVPDEAAIRKHRQALFFSLGGPLPLPLNRERLDGPLAVFADHNVREALYGLYALVRHRHDAQATEWAERCIAAVLDLWDPVCGWVGTRFEALGIRLQTRSFVWGLARAIGPLAKYYRATGHAPALELALRLAEKATREFFVEGGGYDPARFGSHTHSTTSTLSSLAQLADLQRDTALMARVRAFYDRGLDAVRDPLGWVIEHVGLPTANPDRGESNNAGDLVETALILGRWGHDAAFDDAERIVRGHLLPSQLRDISFIAAPPNPDGSDGRRDVAQRLRGAFGFPAPYGHQPVDYPAVHFCLDIVGGAIGSLCEVWREAVRTDEEGVHVELLFDAGRAAVRVESPYTGTGLRITPAGPASLVVRLPAWVAPGSVAVQAGGRPHRRIGTRLYFSDPVPGETITIMFPLAERELVLRHRTRDIRVRLRGDAVVAMDNFGADLTFFDPYE